MNSLVYEVTRSTRSLLRVGTCAALVLGVVMGLAGCAAPASMAATGCGAGLVYVGTDGPQMRALRFDGCQGTLEPIGAAAEAPKSRWMVAHPRLPIVYATIDGGGQNGTIVAYAVSSRSGALSKINEASAGGSGTTHLWLDEVSMTLLASNFGAGSESSVAINADGSLGPLVSTLKATGSGPHRRQASPHAHAATVVPSGRQVLVSDMGADRVFVYGFDRSARTLKADDAAAPRSLVMPAGSGPRRAMFGAGGRYVYVLSELTAEITVLRWDATRERFGAAVQTLQMSPPEFKGTKSSSEMALSADGRFLYAGNRGENQLQVYRVDAESGALTLAQRVASGGEAPWHFDIDATGKWLLVANNRSNRVNLFAIDGATGQLADTGRSFEATAPLSVSFVQVNTGAKSAAQPSFMD